MNQFETMKTISNYVNSIHRDMFGKGPKSCKAYMDGNVLVIYVHGFISPMEAMLVQQQQLDTAAVSRTAIVRQMLTELKGVLQVLLNRTVITFYQDWSFENNSGVIVAQFDSDDSPSSIIDETLCEKLKSEINRVSELTEKIPEAIDVFKVTSDIYVAVRKGILIPLEKAMISKGYQNVLRATKADLEKTYFHRDGLFEQIFECTVSDIFLDWDLDFDAGAVCFMLHRD